jgi:hypothetical protein
VPLSKCLLGNIKLSGIRPKKKKSVFPEFQAFGMIITNQLAVVIGNLKQRKNFPVFGSVFINIEKPHCFNSVLGEWL